MTGVFIRQAATETGVYAARGYRQGQAVVRLEPISWRPHRDRETVQHPAGGHIHHPVLAKVSHSCAPNCRVSFADRTLIAIRNIEPGEQITFDFRTTETRLFHPIQCRCRTPACVGRLA